MKLGEKVIKTKVSEMSFQEKKQRMGNREQNGDRGPGEKGGERELNSIFPLKWLIF